MIGDRRGVAEFVEPLLVGPETKCFRRAYWEAATNCVIAGKMMVRVWHWKDSRAEGVVGSVAYGHAIKVLERDFSEFGQDGPVRAAAFLGP
jgi:hypothetical protein